VVKIYKRYTSPVWLLSEGSYLQCSHYSHFKYRNTETFYQLHWYTLYCAIIWYNYKIMACILIVKERPLPQFFRLYYCSTNWWRQLLSGRNMSCWMWLKMNIQLFSVVLITRSIKNTDTPYSILVHALSNSITGRFVYFSYKTTQFRLYWNPYNEF
jgi:hypothetical protein